MRYAVQRSRSDYFEKTTSFQRFSFTMAVVVILSAFAMFQVIEKPILALGITAAIALTITIMRSPDWTVFPVFLINSTVFSYGSLPSLLLKLITGATNVFYTDDIFLFAALLFAFWGYLLLPRIERPKFSVVGWLLGLFGLLLIFNVIRALIFLRADWLEIWSDVQGLTPFLLYFPIIALMYNRKRARAFFITLAISAAVCFLYNSFLYFHPSGGFYYSEIFGSTDTAVRGSGTAVRAPNLLFMVASVITYFSLYCFSVTTVARRTFLTLCVLTLFTVIINKGRNAYVGCITGLLLVLAIVPWRTKGRAITHLLAIICVLVPIMFAVPQVGRALGGVFEETFARFNQTFDEREYRTGGIKERVDEIKSAMPYFEQNQFLGYGLGRSFSVFVENSEVNLLNMRQYSQPHNSWMFHAVKGGILEVGLLISILLGWFYNTLKIVIHTESSFVKGICWGMVGFMVAAIMGSMVQGNFYLKSYTVPIGIAFALPELAARYVRLQEEHEAAEALKLKPAAL